MVESLQQVCARCTLSNSIEEQLRAQMGLCNADEAPQKQSPQTPDTLAEAILQLSQTWESQGVWKDQCCHHLAGLKGARYGSTPLTAYDLSDRPTPQQGGKPRHAASYIASLIWGMCTRSCFGIGRG